MTTEIKAPTLPESVPDGTIATWYKKPGESASRDELLVDIETDKVVLEVVAPADGVLKDIKKGEGETITSNEVLAEFAEGETGSAPQQDKDGDGKSAETGKAASDAEDDEDNSDISVLMSPAARKLVDENDLDPNKIQSTGKDGRVTKEDVVNYMKSAASDEDGSGGKKQDESGDKGKDESGAGSESKAGHAGSGTGSAQDAGTAAPAANAEGRTEKRVPMSRLRAKVAERLLEATQSTAMLTTFNEVNMQEVMALRNKYKEAFEKQHDGTRLGFMSFFVRACVEALKRFPAVNASLDGSDIIYHGYQDIGVAVSSPRGLVVPVLRDADSMSFADIEGAIREFGEKARDGKLSIEEMTGGTFTISNGGVFGSLLSTPILNPPQTAILGMHKIQERPMAVDGEVKVLPMMYLALSYDHRMIDGKEAVQFLVTIKELLEDPARIFLEV